jgi:hypothetical protein
MNHADESFRMAAVPVGPTALTLGAVSVTRDAAGRHKLGIGVGFDHFACHGDQAIPAIKRLSDILCARSPDALRALTEGSNTAEPKPVTSSP